MLPHASDTFQIQEAGFNCDERQYKLFYLKLSIFVCFVPQLSVFRRPCYFCFSIFFSILLSVLLSVVGI